mgnify:CR=1 FL=1
MTTKSYYKINFPNNTCYIGVTVNLHKRMISHKCRCNKGKHDNRHIQEVYDKYGYDSWIVEELFSETGDKEYHKIREYNLIQETPNTINLNTGRECLLSRTEYSRSPQQHEYNKTYREENRELVNERSRNYHRRTSEERSRKLKERRQGPEGDEVRRKGRENYHKYKPKKLGIPK